MSTNQVVKRMKRGILLLLVMLCAGYSSAQSLRNGTIGAWSVNVQELIGIGGEAGMTADGVGFIEVLLAEAVELPVVPIPTPDPIPEPEPTPTPDPDPTETATVNKDFVAYVQGHSLCVYSTQPYTLAVYSVSGLLMVHNSPQTNHQESLAAGVYIAIMEHGADIRKYKFRIP